jgi:hypothetical protein
VYINSIPELYRSVALRKGEYRKKVASPPRTPTAVGVSIAVMLVILAPRADAPEKTIGVRDAVESDK